MAEKKPSLAEITDETVNQWKVKHGSIFCFETEDKEKKGYFKKPDRVTMDAVSAIANANPVKSNELLANTCFLGGDEDLIKNDEYFFGLSAKLRSLLNVKAGEFTEV